MADSVRRELIEYPAGGGGIYSRTTDYCTLLQHLLRHYLAVTTDSVSRPSHPLLSDSSVISLFKPTITGPQSALQNLVDVQNSRDFDQGNTLGYDEFNWTTGMAVYMPKKPHPRGGKGRSAGSVGWGGAAGTEYFIDPEKGVAVRRADWIRADRPVCLHNANAAGLQSAYPQGKEGDRDGSVRKSRLLNASLQHHAPPADGSRFRLRGFAMRMADDAMATRLACLCANTARFVRVVRRPS